MKSRRKPTWKQFRVKRISVDVSQLRTAINAHRPNWKEWREIKSVFLDFQDHKCGFCERNIGGRPDPRTGRRDLFEQDVEHFRPKEEVVPWTPPSAWPEPPTILNGPAKGYPWLAKDERNYVCACQTCNRARKKSFFPIASPLSDYSGEPGPDELAAEQPYLIFPFGFLEAKAPEDYIVFVGPEPVPHEALAVGSHDYWRARITIEVIGLDRGDDYFLRCELVAELGRQWCLDRRGGFDRYLRPNAQFSSCAASYIKLCETSPAVAQSWAIKAAKHVGWAPVEVEVLQQRWPRG